MSIDHFSLEGFFYSRNLKEFAYKPGVSIIEKTARIAAALFLAIPAFLLDLTLMAAHTIHNKFTILFQSQDRLPTYSESLNAPLSINLAETPPPEYFPPTAPLLPLDLATDTPPPPYSS